MSNSPAQSQAQSIGRMEGTLVGILHTLEMMSAQQERFREEAAAARTAMGHEIARLENEVASIRAEINRVQPLVDALTGKLARWQAIGVGALLVFMTLGATLDYMFGHFGKAIQQVVAGWRP